MPVAEAEFSVLLWALGGLVAALAVHLGQGWVRVAQRHASLRREWRALLLAAAVLGIGIGSALELGMQAQPLAFPVGYRWLTAALLVPLATLVCLPAVVAVMLCGQGAWSNVVLFGSGALLAGATISMQIGWVWAAGFRPGVLWNIELVAAAGVLSAFGLALAQWLGHAPVFQDSQRRALWRLGAAGVAALTLMFGQQLMALAAGLETQKISSFSGELHGAVLSVICAVLVPLVLVAMILDLWLRRHQRHHHGHGDFNPGQRRKRRHKVRTL
jgi:NO-binding membrane sensor protein with MHYT domain